MRTHKDLEIWHLALSLVEMIYQITQKFPKEEVYGLTSQLRRAAISIQSNIAEGAARNSKNEFLRFMYIALDSLAEFDTQTIVAERVGYGAYPDLYETIEKLRRKMLNFIKHLNSHHIFKRH